MVKKVERDHHIVSRKRTGSKYKEAVNRGAWTAEEDRRLVEYVRLYGDRKWRTLPSKAGLNRCGKSCRLRWLNYLRPGIRRGNISEDEEDLIIRLHNLLGNRWSLIAARLPGRTDNEIKNHWNTHLSKKTLTIDDLNNKINQQTFTGNVILRDSVLPDAIQGTNCEANTNNEHPDSSAELSGFDLEFIQLFNFSSVPDSDHSNSESGNEYLRIEDYGFACANDDLVWENINEACFESQLSALDSLFDGEDYSSLFLN